MPAHATFMGRGVTLELIGTHSSTVNNAVQSFAGKDIGAGFGNPASSLRRRVYIVAMGGNGQAITGVTMNGNAMTYPVFTVHPGGTNPAMIIAYAFPTFPANTTADFSVTFSSAVNRCSLYILRVIEDTNPTLDVDKEEDSSTLATSVTIALDSIMGAIELYAACIFSNTGPNVSINFSSATRLDYRVAQVNVYQIALAVRRTEANVTNHVETISWAAGAKCAALGCVIR